MKDERYSIIYSSKTGNTKKLAETIYKILPQNEVIFPKLILEIWRKFAANFHFENKKCFLAEKQLSA